MQERIIFIRTDEYDIDYFINKYGMFNQSRLRGRGLARVKKGDLVHLLTDSDYKIKYTCVVSDTNDNTGEATLEIYDEYKGIPLSFLEKKKFCKKRARKIWDFVDGLYKQIKHKGERNILLSSLTNIAFSVENGEVERVPRLRRFCAMTEPIFN
ncbi:MAG: hypothetical protein FWB91_10745 [Defluviitaleaceae bacterium]|nr:hypothetical protein [Defluviitaleaceae bacterium]